MRVYMDMNRNEIVSETIARSRMRASVDGENIMYHLYHHVGWDELQKHMIDDGFITNIIDELSDNWFDERFEEYDLIESE